MEKFVMVQVNCTSPLLLKDVLDHITKEVGIFLLESRDNEQHGGCIKNNK